MSPWDKFSKILRDYEVVEDAIKFPEKIADFIKQIVLKIEGRPLRPMLPLWLWIFNDPIQNKIIMAGRQVGKSTYIGIMLLFTLLTKPGSTLCYVTYDEVNLSHYSNQKFRRGILNAHPIIKTKLIKNERGEVAAENDSTIFFVTDEGEYKHVEGTSASIVMLDEVQYQDLQFLPVLRETMSYVLGSLDMVGRGGEAGSEYERTWNDSDQQEWEFTLRDPRSKLKFGPEGLIWGEYIIELWDGKFVRKKPQNYLHPGYWLPQTIFPHIPLTIKDAIEKYKISPEFSIEWKRQNYPKSMFEAHVMARFYKAPRRPITEEMIRACMNPYREIRQLTPEDVNDLKYQYGQKCTVLMGVDWGSGNVGTSSTVISVLVKIVTGATDDTARYILAYMHKVNHGEEGEPDIGMEEAEFVVQQFNRWHCDYGVADLGYGEIQVKVIQEGGVNPKTNERFDGLHISKFIGCRTIEDVTAPEQDILGEVDDQVEEFSRLQVDKTHVIDNFVNFLEWKVNYVPRGAIGTKGEYARPKLMIPYSDEYWLPNIIKEWTNIQRLDLEKSLDVAKDDKRQFAKKKYNHPPDTAMSLIYCMIADNNFRQGGSDFGGISFRSTRR